MNFATWKRYTWASGFCLLAMIGSAALTAEPAAEKSETAEQAQPATARATTPANKGTDADKGADANSPVVTKAFIDGVGPDWKTLGGKDFTHVNCDPETWTWKDGHAHCTGKPTGVIRSVKPYTNFELVLHWQHLKSAGNSGVFVWGVKETLDALKPGQLPHGFEVQILDHGYAENYEKAKGVKSDWFSTNGDVFPVGTKMKPFPPLSANGTRSFPSKNLSKGINQWNHYYIRAINGEIRLWVNGEEVSGGTDCNPRSGYLCLESEGSPVEFKNIRIRELP